MRKFYKIRILFLFAFLVLNISLLNAQLTVMATGNYTIGGISDNGVVSMHTSSGTIYKWDSANGLVQIGNISNGYPAAGRTLITADGSKIASSITNAGTNFNEISTYNTGSSTWTNLGGLVPTGWDGSVSSTWGMSPNGNTIVGLGWINAGTAHAVKWTAQNGMTDLGSMIANRSSRANAVNADGSVIVGWQDQADGFRSGAKWVDGVGSFITDINGNSVGEAGDVSADGNTIIGMNTPEPYVWNSTTGLTYITHPNSSAFFRGGATGISADGSKVIGFFRPFPGPPMTGEGFFWTAAGGRVNLNDYATNLGINTQGVTMSLPLAISQDGKKIAGVGMNAANQIVAFYLDLTEYLSTSDVVKTKNTISIYPNPVEDIIYIKKAGKIDRADVYNKVGQRVAFFDSVADRIDVSSLSPGNYVLQIFVKGEVSQSFTFIKQ
ncbi:Por secretion system C-terminal sorting domain-containing protein [Chryseobacterium soldanellicola]|uniref:Por secretion system C-terminal sorting domain-containing protein n=1 Tax=Chryseobacterium soldanellicola TaxID=311333 RepID=A0A1H1D4K3_9FLAO|nr:T9SS type A sorting domain-containing protein [Chryseobacterium soldanellicola]SDQ71374.1 Por secretion system C-terminal sorting domain-containing protein [Chryseobacterium soldanellicola]